MTSLEKGRSYRSKLSECFDIIKNYQREGYLNSDDLFLLGYAYGKNEHRVSLNDLTKATARARNAFSRDCLSQAQLNRILAQIFEGNIRNAEILLKKYIDSEGEMNSLGINNHVIEKNPDYYALEGTIQGSVAETSKGSVPEENSIQSDRLANTHVIEQKSDEENRVPKSPKAIPKKAKEETLEIPKIPSFKRGKKWGMGEERKKKEVTDEINDLGDLGDLGDPGDLNDLEDLNDLGDLNYTHSEISAQSENNVEIFSLNNEIRFSENSEDIIQDLEDIKREVSLSPKSYLAAQKVQLRSEDIGRVGERRKEPPNIVFTFEGERPPAKRNKWEDKGEGDTLEETKGEETKGEETKGGETKGGETKGETKGGETKGGETKGEENKGDTMDNKNMPSWMMKGKGGTISKSEGNKVYRSPITHAAPPGPKGHNLLASNSSTHYNYKSIKMPTPPTLTPKSVQFTPSEEEELSRKAIEKLMEEEKNSSKDLQSSERLAHELEEEEKAESSKRALELEERTKSTCPICLDDIGEAEYYLLDACGHLFHKECITQHVQHSLRERKFPLFCPDTLCKREFSTLDIRELFTKDEYTEFETHSFKDYVHHNADEVSCCATPDCQYVFLYDAEVDSSDFVCPLCHQHYCLNCRCKYHTGSSCKEYQISSHHTKDDEKFLKFVKGKKYKQCPKCKFWVERTSGCDHMSCRCGFQFCYKCGGKYGDCECVKKAREAAEARRLAPPVAPRGRRSSSARRPVKRRGRRVQL